MWWSNGDFFIVVDFIHDLAFCVVGVSKPFIISIAASIYKFIYYAYVFWGKFFIGDSIYIYA